MARSFWRPELIFVEQGVCEDDGLSLGCGNSDRGMFSLCHMAVVNTIEVRVEPQGDDARHLERLPQSGTITLDEAATSAFARLARDGRLTFLHRAKFGRVGQKRMNCDHSQFRNTGQHVRAPG
ncbi:hypothetical protein [Komagataeibacter europaeus]|uniref:hypothetical protein n=1 Tax=Komagataeibacter europaeus TaxID=33995 RepID=UPI0012DD139D|nr:hypothetical protein [Komagataeibacter europaeus]